jgi:hypothetical protein
VKERSVTAKVREIYEHHIKSLPVAERLQLLAMLAQDVAAQSIPTSEPPRRQIMDLHGLGKEIWQGIDAHEYVDELRQEWVRDPDET